MTARTNSAVRWLPRLALAGVVLCLAVVVLGAYVRLSAAGLGCPDWPGCYGHLTPAGAAASEVSRDAFPTTPLDVGKAWREMIHRYAATTLGLVILAITVLAFATFRRRIVPPGYALGLLATVIFQGVLGMLTVTWKLKPLIVTLHLLGGMTTLALLFWLWLGLRSPRVMRTAAPSWSSLERTRTARSLALAALAALTLQIALGGWTSSNYAAIACPDVPTCQNRWWPDTDYRDAFILWRGLDVNYEGGILTNPARVAIQLTHRLGACVVALLLLFASAAAFRAWTAGRVRAMALAVTAVLCLQIAVAIAMVRMGFPLWLATAHNGVAALLLLATLGLNHAVRRAA